MGTEGKQSVYLQIAESIKRDIRTGFVADGEKLPSCRELAVKLGINPNTVQRAYAELEEQGYISTVPKKGVYARSSPLGRELAVSCEEVLRSLKESGLKKDEIVAILDKVYGGEQ